VSGFELDESQLRIAVDVLINDRALLEVILILDKFTILHQSIIMVKDKATYA
jgi:hypothetical protein